MAQISIISTEEATVWKNNVVRLNEETALLLNNVGNTLKEINQDAESEIIDSLYKYGNQVVTESEHILYGMNKLVDTVDMMISKLTDLVDSSKKRIDSAISEI